jgi:ribosomal protein L7/L12
MAAAYGVRLIDCGPNRLAVLAKARPLLQRPPAEVRAAVDRGPVLLAEDIGRWAAERLATEFEQLGATVEIFVSIPCCEPDPGA